MTRSQKPVLDACCGGRMMWFDKEDDRAVFADIRRGSMPVSHHKSQTGRSDKVINPDVISDFRNMDFPDNHFHHVVFDPPHVRGISMKSVTGFSYGSLDGKTWKSDIKAGFSECFRVLKPYGTLIFKWNETDIPLRDVLSLTPFKPLYGHRSGKKANTHWVCFMKEVSIDE